MPEIHAINSCASGVAVNGTSLITNVSHAIFDGIWGVQSQKAHTACFAGLKERASLVELLPCVVDPRPDHSW